MKYLLLLLFSCITGFVYAQTYVIKGSIQLEKTPVEGATVILKPLNIKTGTGADGTFQFTQVKAGTYQLIVTYVGAS